MKITIVSEFKNISDYCAEKLEGIGHEAVDTCKKSIPAYEIRHGKTVSKENIASLKAAIAPFSPEAVPDDTIAENMVLIHLGDAVDAGNWDIKISSVDEGFNNQLRAELQQFGFNEFSTSIAYNHKNVIKYGGASKFSRDQISWVLDRHGVDAVEMKSWEDDDNDIYISVCQPEIRNLPVLERFPINVCVDDPDIGRDVIRRVREIGFKKVNLDLIDSSELLTSKITVDVGPLLNADSEEEISRLLLMVGDVVKNLDIDKDLYPIKRRRDSDLGAILTLPLMSCLTGKVRPYGENTLSCFEIKIGTEDKELGDQFVEKLLRRGFSNCTVIDPENKPFGPGPYDFYVGWKAAALNLEVRETVDQVMHGMMDEIGASGEPYLHSSEGGRSENEIYINFPAVAFRVGIYQSVRANPGNYAVEITGSSDPAMDRLESDLSDIGFNDVENYDDYDSNFAVGIFYGRAPKSLVDKIAKAVLNHIGEELPVSRSFNYTSKKIVISIPPDDKKDEETPSKEDPENHGYGEKRSEKVVPLTPIVARSVDHQFIRIDGDFLIVGENRLLRCEGDNKLVPDPSSFSHFCLDQSVAETIMHIAESIIMKEPCCLEGATSTSKTSSIMYLASLLNQPVIRLNLSGQTDTSELVGKYIPNTETGGWIWQNGAVVESMTKGYFLLSDEINLAEPQIIERLNSVLESEPSLVLSEHDGMVLGAQGTPVNPRFRIFATLNPVDDYAGRSALSPAFRDRFQGYRIVPESRESEYASMLRLMVFGTQPSVTIDGIVYSGSRQSPVYPELQNIDGIERIIINLARFHESIESVARAGKLGVIKKEKYVFTRRGLLSVFRFLSQHIANSGSVDVNNIMLMAVDRYYLSKLSSEQDRQTAASLLKAVGFNVTDKKIRAA